MNLENMDSVQTMQMNQKFHVLVLVPQNTQKLLKKINIILKSHMYYQKTLKLFKLKL